MSTWHWVPLRNREAGLLVGSLPSLCVGGARRLLNPGSSAPLPALGVPGIPPLLQERAEGTHASIASVGCTVCRLKPGHGAVGVHWLMAKIRKIGEMKLGMCVYR